jgi:hypothetical protein
VVPSQPNGAVDPRGESAAAGQGVVRGRAGATTAGWPAKNAQGPWSTAGTDPRQNDVVPRAPFHDSETWMWDVCGSPPE